jgi:SAM-dependent methyltransferase
LFACNICGASCELDPKRVRREDRSCWSCGSTARSRSVIHALSVALFHEPLRITDFPTRRDLRGLGLSDAYRYADRLAAKFSYTNTFLEREPRLDITAPPPDMLGKLDFVIASDVFEHVPPPIERAFDGVLGLLKSGGVFVLTVPYKLDGGTVEHFPDLHEFEVVQAGESATVVNTSREGQVQTYENVRLHGGAGLVVEMREFSLPALVGQLRLAGFAEITDWRERRSELPGVWTEDTGFPLSAVRP